MVIENSHIYSNLQERGMQDRMWSIMGSFNLIYIGHTANGAVMSRS